MEAHSRMTSSASTCCSVLDADACSNWAASSSIDNDLTLGHVIPANPGPKQPPPKGSTTTSSGTRPDTYRSHYRPSAMSSVHSAMSGRSDGGASGLSNNYRGTSRSKADPKPDPDLNRKDL